ncbi:putative terminase large subunit domain protein, partial [Clostridioides difficile 842]
PEGYKVYGLGEWGETGGAILKNYVIHEFPTESEYFDNMRLSQDFGFNHANVVLRIALRMESYIYVTKYMHMKWIPQKS